MILLPHRVTAPKRFEYHHFSPNEEPLSILLCLFVQNRQNGRIFRPHQIFRHLPASMVMFDSRFPVKEDKERLPSVTMYPELVMATVRKSETAKSKEKFKLTTQNVSHTAKATLTKYKMYELKNVNA